MQECGKYRLENMENDASHVHQMGNRKKHKQFGIVEPIKNKAAYLFLVLESYAALKM